MASKKNVKAIYDTCRTLVKQAEEKAANNEKIDDSILNPLTAAFNEIIEFEKIYLIQCNDRFWGAVLMDLDLGIDYTQRGAIDLKINRNPFMLGINPMFCAQYTFAEFTGLIINELTKMVYLHPAVYGQINHEKDERKHKMLDKSSDAASTSIVKSDIRLDASSEYGGGNSSGCRLPQGSYTPTQLNKECKVTSQDKMPLEYYYKILSKQKQEDQDQGQGNNNSMPSGSGYCVATQNNNDGQNTHDWENASEDETKEAIISIVKNAYDSLNERQRGLIPAGIASQIKALLAPPEINWKQDFKRMVGSVPVPYKKTRTRLNRRQPFRSDLCGKLPKRTVNVVCAFDTSGSMSDSDLMYCMNEVFNIIKCYEGYSVTIIECDAEIQRIYKAKSMADVQTKMKGRGGTSFIPVIRYINGEKEYSDVKKYPMAGKYRDALLVYFTDGYGDYEIPKPKTYRNLWVVLHDVKNLSLKNPYGDVKSLSMDADYKKLKGIR